VFERTRILMPETRSWTIAGLATLVAFVFASALDGTARAGAVDDFYRGKTVNLYIGAPSGGGYDIYARLVARHLGAHIPGKPFVVPRNMPGAGGRTSAGHVYSVAVPDGLSLNASEQALALEQAIGDHKIPVDMAKFNWIGSPNSDNKVVTTWHTSGVQTVEDAKRQEVVMGATSNTTSAQYLKAMNALIGTRFKIVFGYPGGNEVNLAVEKGEVAGRGSSSWATWKARPDVLRDRKVNVLVQVGFSKAPELPDVPLLMELATKAEDRAMLELLSAPSAIGHPLVTSPGVPKERVDALRAAFDAMMRDPAFLADAAQAKLDISPTPGAQLAAIVNDILSAPAAVRDRLGTIILGHK
jgi:tripartite-type tricarboxylate transporter receptor subunit TctC